MPPVIRLAADTRIRDFRMEFPYQGMSSRIASRRRQVLLTAGLGSAGFKEGRRESSLGASYDGTALILNS